jgi:LacI family transcriptional regulator
MDKITIRTLAKDLKLAVSTVSKALTDSHEISAETKLRVNEFARQKNYVPNAYASSLRKRKSRTIAVVLPEVADSFFSLAINGIEAAAQEKGYHVLIYLTHESFIKEQAILNNFQGGRVDGILLSITRETPNSAHIKELINEGIPVVFFDRVCDEIETTKIITNDFEISYKATQHLIEQGCKKIAFLSFSETLAMTNQRLEGYKKALLDYKIKLYPADLVVCTNDAEQNHHLVRKLLQQKKIPDGILACVEKLTTPIYIACKEKKLSIPKDIKVICFSSLETAPILNPSLTTVTQPAFELGKTAATLLMKALDKPNFVLKQEYITLPSTIIIRGSTGIRKTKLLQQLH